MRLEKHHYSYPIESIFPNMKSIVNMEGGSIYTAEKDNLYYIIVDEGSMADFLLEGEDDDLLNELIKIFEFDHEEERTSFMVQGKWKRRRNMGNWEEGLVDIHENHIKITYEGNPKPIALVAETDGRIIVQFFPDATRNDQEKEEVNREIEFYIYEHHHSGMTPWQYVIYHSNTGANLYSSVHWGFFPKE